jgi:hypothetical protein
MTFWRRIFQRRRDAAAGVPPVWLDRALRDALAQAASQGCSPESLAAVYSTLLDAGNVYLATEGARGRVGTFEIGPGDEVQIATTDIPEGGPAIIVHTDLRSASREFDGGELAGMTLREAANMALRAQKALVLMNLESSHPSGSDWLFIPV